MGSQAYETGGCPSPIAIIGMSCRLPGGVNSSSELWEFLAQGKSGKCDIPQDRFNASAFYHPKGLTRPGSMTTKGGYFLQEDPRLFDHEFFDILPLEAMYMDPQQRKLLEVVYEAFENAGTDLDAISGANVGCYVGSFAMDYQSIQNRDPDSFHRYVATGMSTSILGNRISHVFNLKGPSMVVDTACSSSLYSLHLACTALNNRECNAAVVAGANIIMSPQQQIATVKAGILSATSTCHTFSEDADGYGRGEAVGCLFLKRLEDAIENNDPIRAIIAATAVNSNGRVPGITQPSAASQASVIRKAYMRAGYGLNQTSYVECHGTGTPVGDPIEIEGLSTVFSGSSNPMLLGSVKTNMGHSEAASGITAVMKTVLSLENGFIPATIGITKVNPNLRLEGWNAEIVRQMKAWPALPSVPSLRRAGVNSFGYGGANAHAILESGEWLTPSGNGVVNNSKERHQKWYLVPVSAKSSESLEARIQQLDTYLSRTEQNIEDIAYTLSVRRTHFSHRTYFVANQDGFHSSLGVQEALNSSQKTVLKEPSQTAFVFTGQGAQWAGMGAALYRQFPVFAAAIDDMDSQLRNLPHPPTLLLSEVICDEHDTSRIHDVAWSQPACTAVQVALVILLRSWKILPSVVVGHSSGEIAAAFAAGFLSAAQAITIAYYRGYAVKSFGGEHGAMMAVGLSPSEAELEIESSGLSDRLWIGCFNSPTSVTISGDSDAIELLHGSLIEKKVFARRLLTNGRAYHSHHMKTVGAQYESLLLPVQNQPNGHVSIASAPRWISSVTGEEKITAPDPTYWRTNLESPTLFTQAMSTILSKKGIQVIEVGPHAALKVPINQIRDSLGLSPDSVLYTHTLSRNKNDVSPILRMIGSLYIQGRSIAWEQVNSLHIASTRRCVPKVVLDLPPYPWRYGKIMWHESRESYEFRYRKYPRHELLGSLVPGGDGVHKLWRNELKLDDVPWLRDHKLEQTIVLPGAAYISMVLESANQIADTLPQSPKVIQLDKVTILTALAIPEERSIELFTTLLPSKITTSTFSTQQYDFQITSYEMGIPTVRATGSVSIKNQDRDLGCACEIPTNAMQPTQARIWYSRLRDVGLQFGSAFQSIDEFGVPRARDKQLCYAQIRKIEDYDPDSEYILHPTVIDAMIQSALVATSCGRVRDLRPKVPVSFHSIVVQIPLSGSVTSSPSSIASVARQVGFEASRFDAELTSSLGTTVCQIKEGKLVTYNPGDLDSSHVKRRPMLRVRWMPDVYGLGLIPRHALVQYLQRTACLPAPESGNEDIKILKGVLDLLIHKNPALRILQVRSNTLSADKLDQEPCVRSWVPDTSSCMAGFIDLAGDLYISSTEASASSGVLTPPVSKAKNERFHLALLSFQDSADITEEKLATIKTVLEPRGMILCLDSGGIAHQLEKQGFEVTYAGIDAHPSLVLGRLRWDRRAEKTALSKLVYVIGRHECDVTAQFASHLARFTGDRVITLSLSDINQTSIAPGSTVFVFIEISEPLLPAVSQQDLESVKVMTDNAAHLVWVTSSNILSKPRPDFGLAFGLSRAVMMEQPATKFYVIDVDDIYAETDTTFSNIISILNQDDDKLDYEFAQSNGVVHVCRFVPDDKLNSRFQQIRGKIPEVKTLGSLGPVKLTIGEAGMFDSLYFRPVTIPTKLSPHEVRFTVKSVGLNAKDYYAFAGKVDTRAASCTLEHAGIVEAVGSEVVDFAPGDRIVAMAPAHFQTSEVVPSWACQKLFDDETFEVMCTLPIVFSTAIYALQDRARLQSGETVLIHSAAGGVGQAAVQVAQLIGATVFATVSTDEKAEHLSKNFGVPRENIFTSRNISFLSSVLAATGGRGVDVVLNSLTGEALHASWKCCASFGRFVEIGKQDMNNYGILDMQGFLQSKTFTAFDLSDIYYDGSAKCQQQWSRLLGDVLALFRSGKITMVEAPTVFSVTQVADAMRHFASRNRIGKVVVNLDDPNAQVLTLPESFSTTFDEGKTYLMVGCLGGLGGSLSKWMVSRGARKFVFLGRSGLQKPAAKDLVRDLELLGATCKIIQGDVCNRKDVDAAIAAVEGKIGGVVQAAMALNEALFTAMGHDAWHEAVDPKLAGTWNLHHSLESRDDQLAFFLLMSSVSGSIGTATESNYCSASFFLDLFARYRRSLGLPATSIGLGMIAEVGYLHENPGIETILRRHGIHAMNEDEMLLVCDLMLSKAHAEVPNYDGLSSCHVLTGMETLGLQALRDDGFDVTNLNLDDPRASYLNRDFKGTNLSQVQRDHEALPAEIIAGLEEDRELSDLVVEHISRRFSTLVLLPVDKIDVAQPLSTYGMDSMIAAEFRTWFYQTFHLDIPFLDMLDSKATPISLAERVIEQTVMSRDGESGIQAQS
ncbi:polyketide synthase [Xylaria digitata]|nr:polyketide synthase [Xylaria digitata]